MFLLLLAAGCDALGHGCNFMYAPSELNLTVTGLTDGAWEWTADVGDHGVVCTATLPDGSDAACEGDAFSAPTLAQQADGSWSAQVLLVVGESGPVSVTATHDGDVVLDVEREVEWSTDEPNGEGCGERVFAELEVTVE